jgi:tape measure domain-containing protein
MQVGMEGLLAREISKGDKVTEAYEVVTGQSKKQVAEAQKYANLADSLSNKQESLNIKLQDYSEQLAIAQQRLVEVNAQKKKNASSVMAAERAVSEYNEKIARTKEELAETNNTLAATNDKLADNQAAAMATSTAYRTVYVNQMNLQEAMPLAQEKAKALMDELSRIAILSPYELATVQNTFKMAMTFGYSSEEAKKFTTAILNVGAGTGATNEVLNRMAYNFAQIRMVGKVTAMDIRQLAMAGFDLVSVLQYAGDKFGVAIENQEDFNKAIESGKLTWEDFTEAFAEYADTNFGGASERMSTTIMGLQSTMHDVFTLTMPQIVLPTMNEVNARLSDFLNLFLDVRDSGVLEDLGQQLLGFTKNALKPVDALLSNINRYRDVQKKLTDLKKGGMGLGSAEERREFQDLTNEAQNLTHGLGILGIVMDGIFGPSFTNKIAGPIKTAIQGFDKLKAIVLDLTKGDIKGALEGLGLPSWLVGSLEKGAKYLGDMLEPLKYIGSKSWREILSGMGFPEGIITGVEKISSGLSAIWRIVQAPFDPKSGIFQELDKILNPPDNGSNVPGEYGIQKRLEAVANGEGDTVSRIIKAGSVLADYLIKGFVMGAIQIATGLEDITAEMKRWAEDPQTEIKVRNVAHQITTALLNEMKAVLGSSETGDSLLESLVGALLNSLANIGQALVAVGKQAAHGITDGIVEFFSGDPILQEMAESIQQAIDQVFDLINWTKWFVDVRNKLLAPFGLEATGPLGLGTKKKTPDAAPSGETGAAPPVEDDPNGGVSHFATGGDFITNGPRLILVGDNASGREHVSITPAGGMSKPAGITINIDARGADPGKVKTAAEQGVRQALRAGGLA